MPFPYFLYRNTPFPQDRYTLGKNVQLSFSFSEKSCKLYLLYPNFQDCATLISSKKQAKPARRSRHAPQERRSHSHSVAQHISPFAETQKPALCTWGWFPSYSENCSLYWLTSCAWRAVLSGMNTVSLIVRLRESLPEAPGRPAPDLRYVPPPFPRDTGSRPWNSSSNNRSYPPG